MKRRHVILLAFLILPLVVGSLTYVGYVSYRGVFQPYGLNTIVSSDGVKDGPCTELMDLSISADGRYVAFVCSANSEVFDERYSIVQGVFFHDRLTGDTIPISIAQDGTLQRAFDASISGDGRYIAFASKSSKLVAQDTNKVTNIFVYDRKKGKMALASLAFDDHLTNGPSFTPMLTPDGRYVAFSSDASNLVVGDTNHSRDIFIRDLRKGKTFLISRGLNGASALGDSVLPGISFNGRFVVFFSNANNLTDDEVGVGKDATGVFVYDRQAEKISFLTNIPGRSIQQIAFSDWYSDYPPSITSDGKVVTFESLSAFQEVDGSEFYWPTVAVFDREVGRVEIVGADSTGQRMYAPFGSPTISENGRYVAFETWASFPGIKDYYDKDVFRLDRETGVIQLVTLAPDGGAADEESYWPVISADGQHVAFVSKARNLRPVWDTNGSADVYIHDFGDWHPYLVSVVWNALRNIRQPSPYPFPFPTAVRFEINPYPYPAPSPDPYPYSSPAPYP